MFGLVTDLLRAVIFLGLPLAVVSWFLFSWLFNNGDLDRELDSEALKSSIKKLKRSAISAEAGSSKTRFIYDKWMWFGSGFYGLAGLWTFAVIEVTQFFAFIFNIDAWSGMFSDGLISFLIDFALNQLGNMLQGLVWFTWWPSDSTLLWVLVAFLGYRAGLQGARQGVQFSTLSRWQAKHAAQLPLWLQRFMVRIRSDDKEPDQ